ncbi:hypothetical protein [Clostridium saccharobutylicum]|uniref:Uncharacterized protein n=1 Tax=Clostridium saccharobutylicum TaxID=169679 RepID=A0A1S8MZD8_CLOSA|nr:hypothetical protein [Clostridium saccharobutylicum]OOM09421.1 hypothetical protein CLOSAC_37020 [Clostridium saccharobutylicum]
MSRADTVNQKIRRNIKYLFRESEILAKVYREDMVFDYIEAICHRIVLHHDPIYTIAFDNEIEMLKVVVKANPNSKAIKSYYYCVIETNEQIKNKYENKISKEKHGKKGIVDYLWSL